MIVETPGSSRIPLTVNESLARVHREPRKLFLPRHRSMRKEPKLYAHYEMPLQYLRAVLVSILVSTTILVLGMVTILILGLHIYRLIKRQYVIVNVKDLTETGP